MSNTSNVYRGINYNLKKMTELGVYAEQVHNLIDLADVLRKSPPPKFDMETFALVSGDVYYEFLEVSPKETQELGKRNECGTVCCAAGTGAYYGIGNPKKHEDWLEYVERVFTGSDDYSENDIFDYLFSSDWEGFDNTAKGAANRILRFVTEGLPENNSFEDLAERYSEVLILEKK